LHSVDDGNIGQKGQNPNDVVTHHDLIKLIIEHALQKNDHTWNDIIQPPLGPSEAPIAALPAPPPTVAIPPPTQEEMVVATLQQMKSERPTRKRGQNINPPATHESDIEVLSSQLTTK
jgi:hypothetical protein